MSSDGNDGTGRDGRMTMDRRVPAFLLLLLGLAALPPAFAAPDDGRKISPEVAKLARASRPGDLIPVIVQTVAEPTDGHMGRLHGRGGVLKVRHTAIVGYSATLPAEALDALAEDPEVERVSLDGPVRAFLDIAVKAVRADVAAAERPFIDGRGIGIAMVDTGVSMHADLELRKGLSRPIEIDFVDRGTGFDDPFGHGTHVAGILNGSGLLSSGPDAFRTFRGIAPGARLISLRALQPDGSGQTSDVLAAIDKGSDGKPPAPTLLATILIGSPDFQKR